MKVSTLCPLIALLLFCTKITFAQNLYYFGVLPVIHQTGKINDTYSYNLTACTIAGSFDKRSNVADHSLMSLQLFLQGSVIYSVNKKLKLAIGYTYQRNYPFWDKYTNEHRLWEQCTFSIPIKAISQTNRLRLEERFINNKLVPEYAYTTRFRYQLGLNFPLKGPTLDQNEFYFSAYNEFCFSTANFKSVSFSENWTYGGFGYFLGAYGKIECGYLSQVLMRKTGNIHLNLLQLMWVTNFDLFKRNKEEH